MNRIFDFFILMILLAPTALSAASGENSAVDKTDESIDYVSVTVDRVMVDTDGLAIASQTLAESIDGLALAIGQLSADSNALTDAEKQTLCVCSKRSRSQCGANRVSAATASKHAGF